MKQIIKIVSVSFTILLLVFASCSVAFASPSSYNTFDVQIQKPNVDDNSGYVELLFENSYGTRYVSVVSWSFTPYFNKDSTDYNFPYVIRNQLTVNNSEIIFNFRTEDVGYGYVALTCADDYNFQIGYGAVSPDDAFIFHWPAPSGYSLVGYHIYGDFVYINDSGLTYNNDFYVSYSETAVIGSYLDAIISLLMSLEDVLGSDTDYEINYESYLNNILLSLNNLESTSSSFRLDFINEVEKLLDYCNVFFDQLKSIVDNTSDANAWLEALSSQLSELQGLLYEIWLIDLDSNGKLYEIKDTLDAILAVLNSKSDTEFTTVNQDEFNSYYDVENSLLNPDVNVSDVMKVEVNQNALTVIWDLVERGLQSHGKVFGMVLTILALGIVALILGR